MKLLGIDIGGTKCACILGEYDIEKKQIQIIEKIAFPTDSHLGASHTLNTIYKNIDELLRKNDISSSDIEICGISCGGPLNSKKGVVLSPPNLPGWDGIEIVKLIRERYGIKTYLQNDANACALAEWKFGAGKGLNNVIFLTFGTGMGAGLILDGKLYVGASDMAGEVGHIRMSENGPVGYGKSGSLEGFCSGGGIAQIARIKVLEKLQMGEKTSLCKDIAELDSLSAKKIALKAKSGDALAAEILKISGTYLGYGLSIIIDILNPELIIIGSVYERSHDLLWPYSKDIIEKEALPHSSLACKIVPSKLAENVGDYAALAVAANNISGD